MEWASRQHRRSRPRVPVAGKPVTGRVPAAGYLGAGSAALQEGPMAGDDRGVTVELPITCSVEERDGHFAAATRQFGMVVYAPTAGGVVDRVDEAVRFYLDGFESLEDARDYLDRHRIEHSVHYSPAAADGADGGHALRWRPRVTVDCDRRGRRRRAP